jgi:hypothetical protein
LIASDFIVSIGRSEPVLQKLQSAYEHVINSLIANALNTQNTNVRIF